MECKSNLINEKMSKCMVWLTKHVSSINLSKIDFSY